MSAQPVADMLADLIGPITSANRSPTPAKAANPANREHPCGFAAVSGAANGLRILRIGEPAADQFAEFAAIRKPVNGPQSQQRRGFSQESQDSQGCPGDATPGRVARLQRLGFDAAEADVIGRRMLARDMDPGDSRVNCTECLHYRPPRCGNHRAAMLRPADLSRDLAALLQRCPGFPTTTRGRARILLRGAGNLNGSPTNA